MHKFTADELAKVLAEHKLWRESGGEEGTWANLTRANLSGADLRGADLSGANLRGANLSGADLSGADLLRADLSGANLRGADLRGADLIGANLRGANLSGANLSGADLIGADLSGADLQDTEGSELALAQITHLPEGQFDAWKKCQDGVIVNIRIPAEARRSHGSERKSRCEWALVLQVYGPDGKPDDELSGVSQYDNAPKIEYRKGEIVRPDGWNEDRWNTCGQGIHFFLTRLEAEAY